jgi:hypothetical protein
MEKRMNYYNCCQECDSWFHGFEFQHTCWRCITEWLKVYLTPNERSKKNGEEDRIKHGEKKV